ncbi:MAG: sel1 repeat family protein [Pseudomonadota bacterium]
MRTYNFKVAVRAAKLTAFAAAIAMTGAMTPSASFAANSGVAETSMNAALRRGVTAYRQGQYSAAIPQLQQAAERNLFFGQYYLARIYADNDGGHTDHVRAYMLYQQIARDFADADLNDPHAAFVADALVELAGYMRRGLPEAGLRANRKRAAEYLQHAALYFNDEDAQFELAKLMLHEAKAKTDSRARQGLDWLSAVAQRGHAGAQAFLADLLWRGKFTDSNPVRALALISVAAKNAPNKDAFWIDDIFQNIFCGASEGVRSQATGLVAEWDSRYGRKPLPPGSQNLEGLSVRAIRTCADGQEVPSLKRSSSGAADGQNDRQFGQKGWTAKSSPNRKPGVGVQAAKPLPDASGYMRAGAMGLGR